jgi:hypothetical protein
MQVIDMYKTIIATLLLGFASSSANAVSVTINGNLQSFSCTGNAAALDTNDCFLVDEIIGNSSPSTEIALIESTFGVSNLNFLYKSDAATSNESGDFDDLYSTSYAAGNEGATISYDGGMSDPYIDCSGNNDCFAFVKDGDNNPNAYIFNLGSAFDIAVWNGKSSILLEDLWPGNGSISHVSLYGASVVPVPAAIWLFGTALIGFIGFSRRIKV